MENINNAINNKNNNSNNSNNNNPVILRIKMDLSFFDDIRFGLP